MKPKRPPALHARLPEAYEWNPSDTQTLRNKIDVASQQWRQDVVDQLEPIADTLGEVRDMTLAHKTALEYKASKELVAELQSKINVLNNSVSWLRYITIGVLVVGVLEKLAEKKGLL